MNYAIITSPISNRDKERLEGLGLKLAMFPLIEIKDLSQIPYNERNFGGDAFKDCDHLIKTEEGEYEIKVFCDVYKGKSKSNHDLITDQDYALWVKSMQSEGKKFEINETGEISSPCISCNQCLHYSPRTLQGRKKVAESVEKFYRNMLSDAQSEIERIDRKIKENEKLKV